MYKTQPWAKSVGLLSYTQFLTKTHLASGMPNVYDNDNFSIDAGLFKSVKSSVEATLLQEHEHVFRKGDNSKTRKELCHSIIGQIVRSIMASLSADNEHLLRSQLDENVPVKTFWRRDDLTDNRKNPLMTLQSSHKADFQIRTELPLPQVGELV